MSENGGNNEEAIAERLRTCGAQLRMTRKGRVHTVDFRSAAENFGPEPLESIRQLERVKELHLLGPEVDDRTVAALASLPQLETLDLEQTAVTDAALPHLSQMQQLKLLVLRGTSVSREAVAELRKQMIGTRIVT
ncbi:MAG: hypothetical protein RIC55_22715 [Pirellulaceae bacterium]